MNENDGKEFAQLGVKPWLIKQLYTLGIRSPTPIQKGCIPRILSGDDCIGAAKTGSGKTFAFALPILQHLAEDPYGIFGLVLTPTHELAYQIADQFSILGQPLKLRVCIVTGGSDQLEESLKLCKRPHIVVAMPGRLADHITGCDTFSLKKIKYLVLDEADRLFSESFQEDLQTIFHVLPAKRQNLLFSATITEDVRESKLLSLNKDASFRPLLSCAPVAMVGLDRGAHTQDLTKNMQYISNEKVKLKVDPKTMKLDKRVDKPLVVMINWLLARQKHVMKYATLYLEQGFDVLSVSCTPWQLMWPLKGSQLVAGDMIKFMSSNENDQPLVVHGFSVAGYMWGEVCVHVMKNPELYQPVMDRVVAQVWDSAADISEITIGVPAAVFPKNHIMQKTLRAYMEYHMKTFHEAATSHYIRSSQLFHTNICRAPALFLLSRSDPVGAEKSNRSVHDSWVEMGIKCTWKCWDKSPHVQHYSHHRKEYLAALYGHLDAYGLVSQPDKMRIRL